MAEDTGNSFLGTLKDFANATPVLGAWTQAAWGPGNYDPSPPKTEDNLTPGSLLSGLLPGRSINFYAEPVLNSPVGAPLKFVLDFGNRTADSLMGAAQYDDYMRSQGDNSWGNLAEGWRKSWDSWGSDSHVTAGQIIGAELTETFDSSVGTDASNPFSAQGAANIDALAKKNWYSEVAGGASDLAAGFITPGLGLKPVAAGFRAAGDVRTLARVESAEESFNSASKAGTLDDLKVGRGKSFVRGALGAPQSGETFAATLRDGSRDMYHASGDLASAMNFLGPRMVHSSEQAKRIMAETAVYARSLPEDSGTHVIANMQLALLGSSKAADEVIRTAPLVMDKIANATAAPLDLRLVGEGQAMLLREHLAAETGGGDVRLSKVMDDLFETPQRQATAAALKDRYSRAAQEAVQIHGIRARIMGIKPTRQAAGFGGVKVDHFDVARLKESRANAVTQHESARTALADAKAELRTLKKERGGLDAQAKSTQRDLSAANREAMPGVTTKTQAKGRQDALDAFGPGKDADYYSREAGSATSRVAETEARIKELTDEVASTRADRDLLNSTPLHDPAEFEQWRKSMDATKRSKKQADYAERWFAAESRQAERALRDDMKRIQQISPAMNATNLWLKDVMAVRGGIELSTDTILPTMLTKAKAGMRDWIGRSYLYDSGDYTNRTIFHVHPKEWVANIGTAYGRRAVNTHDLYKGQQELAMYLKKSGEYSGDEIRDIVNQYIAAGPKNIAKVVEHAGDEMTKRMLLKAGVPDWQIAETVKLMRMTSSETRTYLTGRLRKSEANGDQWVKTNEFPADDATSADHMLDTAFLRSHLSDSVAFPDPHDIKRFVHLQKKFSALRGVDNVAGAIDFYNYWWKAFNLVRPGLFFRNMMDTGLRATMLIGSMSYAAGAMTGSLRKMRNTGVKVGDWAHHSTQGTPLERIGQRLGPQDVTKHLLGDSGVRVDIGGGQKRALTLYDTVDGHASAASVAAVRGAVTNGVSMGEGLMTSAMPLHNQLVKNAEKWDRYKATDPRWESAYRDHAQALLSSPTARKMLEEHTLVGEADIAGPERIRNLFSDPKIRDEYNRLASEIDMSREQFVEQLDWEMENMFPEPGMAEDVLSGRLQGRTADKWVKGHFPHTQRFDIPGQESVLNVGTARAETANTVRKALDGFFKNVVDEPDFWLVRHPVMVKTYSNQVKAEASQLLAARRAKFGDDVVLSEKDIAAIDRRAKSHAITTTRDYMYDATYSTSFTQAVHRIAPFFNPWYDAMRAYSKLIYDNPNRLASMTGLWNAPTNISQWLPEPLVVDINGHAVKTGQEPEQGNGERFFILNSLIGKKGAVGEGVQLRQSSFNTILMGETPWLPGWGPVATVPLAKAINTDQDLALWLSNRKDPVLGTLMKSLWPDGQIPQSDLGSLFQSQLPATWRKAADVLGGGKTYWTNVQYGLNAAYLKSVQDGTPFDPKAAQAAAEKAASNAGLISTLTQGVFGLSPKANVAGSFYVEQMRQLQTLSPEAVKAAGYPSVQAMFSAQFPEAANLTWSFSRNETGVNATLVAQSEAIRLRPMIEDIPDMGWFIVGAQNVGGDFSQTAYNQQKQYTYGITQEGRKVLDSGEVMANTLEGIGWDQYLKTTMQIEQLASQYGFSSDAVSAVKGQVAQMLGRDNPQWFEAYNSRENKQADFLNKADILAADPRMAGRQDMGMYREYRGAMQQVLDAFGLKSLNGNGANSQKAKAILAQVGSQMASQNIGFQQMWERMLYNQVKPRGVALNVDAASGAA